MKERPIIFSGLMVQAILEGRKTQTRRTVKPQPPSEIKSYLKHGDDEWLPGTDDGVDGTQYWGDAQRRLRCPYGVPGDRLWVRENFQPLLIDFNEKGFRCLDEANYKTGKGYYCYYTATDGIAEFEDLNSDSISSNVTPSIHMPRWASRINLEVVGVRVERLQDISEDDARAEGVELWGAGWPKNHFHYHEAQKSTDYKNYLWHGHDVPQNLVDKWEWQYSAYNNARDSFSSLWHLLNAKRGFGCDANPWVWVVEFRRLENEDRQ